MRLNRFSWLWSFALVGLFAYQNCSPRDLALNGFAPNESSSSSQESTNDVGDGRVHALAATSTAARSKMGINLGVFSTQAAVDALGDIGSWYYTYSPHPNRDDSRTKYDSVAWANKYGKEFVPMIQQKSFKYGPGTDACALIEEFKSSSSQAVCDPNVMASTLKNIKALFGANNQPKYLITFNEPYMLVTDAVTGQKAYAMDPKQSAKAFAKILYAAKLAGLTVVSPTTTTIYSPTSSLDGTAIRWMSQFLKACYDLRAASPYPCDIDAIKILNVHEYQCTESQWVSNYGSGNGLRDQIIADMNGYGGVDWRSYLYARPMWLTETNCNWDADFYKAAQAGQFIRTQTETCMRATGQRAGVGVGSLAALISLPSSTIARFAWWNTYANPQTSSDVGSVTPSSANRISAARMLDDNAQWTPAGRAVRQAYNDPSLLGQVDCSDTATSSAPAAGANVVGVFKVGTGIYHGFKDFYCHYGSMSTVLAVWGSGWAKFSREYSSLPSGMVNAGECGPLQGVHRSGSSFFYTYKKGYTCWINSMSMLSSWGGISSSLATQLPNHDMTALGLKATSTPCQ